MLTFLEETLSKINDNSEDLSSITFILPSKRACGFLLNILKNKCSTTNFAPKMISIEEFIQELSDLQIIDSTELLFKSYKVYLKTAPDQEKDSFEVYSTWAITLLNDFNEIDRYLISPKPFFNYLSNIQDLNHWYVKDEKTDLIQNYLKFWDSLFDFYLTLKESLLKENLGYQGLVYRKAVENIEHYKKTKGNNPHIFLGFNALNNAEQTILQELLETENNQVFWDVDNHFYNTKNHSASYFLHKYVSKWSYFEKNKPEFIANNYSNHKNINIVEAQKNIGQAKYIANEISSYSKEKLENTAIVLADESLLHPLLQSLPKNIQNVNITMGVALKTFPTTVFFDLLLNLHHQSGDSFYFKYLLAILNQPIASKLLMSTKQIISKISEDNRTYINYDYLAKIALKEDLTILQYLFGNWDNESSIAIKNIKELILNLKNKKNSTNIDRVIIYELHKVFNKLENLNNQFEYLKTVNTVKSLYSEIIATATIDFKGDAYNGLQIMGVLETRVLDFENVIIASVNEGVFPSGKSNNSFITYDLKKEYKLPTYTEKDAIYTYHFYRLLHRAKNVTLLYNTISDGINAGEKSRFISQIEFEKLENHSIEKYIICTNIPVINSNLKSIKKTEDVINKLKIIAEKGFSPSALTSYIKNPIDFYYKRILGLNELKDVEETVAANTLGTIVHDTLETFYKPIEKSFLTIEALQKMKLSVEDEVNKQFTKSFKGGDFSKGKNLIIFEVAKRFVENFLNSEIKSIKEGNKIKILQIESNLSVQLSIPELGFPVKIHGKVDRVDEYNGMLRIIDYKSGKVEQSHLNIVDWNDVTEDYKYSKIVQVLAYAYMIKNNSDFKMAEAGIISFKSLKEGFLKFTKKPYPKSQSGNSLITEEVFDEYLLQLKKLIIEICNPKIPFTEKEV